MTTPFWSKEFFIFSATSVIVEFDIYYLESEIVIRLKVLYLNIFI